MPIYAYRCAACGHAKDVLQKMSDPVLSTCPACGADTFQKQLTAAGFQLKGSGWYVTDFKGGANATKPADAPAGAETKAGEGAAAEAKGGETKPAETPAASTSSSSGATPSDGPSGGTAASAAVPAAESRP